MIRSPKRSERDLFWGNTIELKIKLKDGYTSMAKHKSASKSDFSLGGISKTEISHRMEGDYKHYFAPDTQTQPNPYHQEIEYLGDFRGLIKQSWQETFQMNLLDFVCALLTNNIL